MAKVKKWHGIEELVDKEINIPKELWKFEEIMREIPNFDKADSANKIFEKDEYIILKVKSKNRVGYILYNTKKTFKNGHTHIKGYSMAKTIIDNCIKKKTPKTSNLYLLTSHIRISTDEKYIKRIEELIEAKKHKDKIKYINKSK